MKLTAISRQRALAELIGSGAGVTISEIAESYRVSTETIRRDLQQLERNGLVERVHGGAVPAGRAAPVSLRIRERQMEKSRIAALTAPLLEAGQFVFMTGGSTMLEVARALRNGPVLNVMTNMPAIAEALQGGVAHKVSLTGGAYEHGDGILVGEQVIDTITACVFDVAVVGVYGLDQKYGLLEASRFHQKLKQCLFEQARRVIVVADRSKFGALGHFRSGPLERISAVVTDEMPSADFCRRFAECGVRLLHPLRT